MKEIADLKTKIKRFTKAGFEQLKSKTESQVTSWFWATSDLYNPEPFHYESNNWAKGRKLKAEPGKKAQHHHYGLNAQGEIIVERQYTSFEQYFYELFFIRTQDTITRYRFSYDDDKEIEQISRFYYEQDQLTKHITVTDNQCKCDYASYHYDSHQKLIEKKCHLEFDDFETDRNHEYKYEHFGLLETITENQESIIYQKPDKSISFKQLTAMAEERLFNVLRQNIHQHTIKEELYCLYLCYGNDNLFPPAIAYGTKTEKDHWQTQGIKAKWVIWNPADYQYNMEVSMDGETENFFDLYNQETEMLQKYAVAKKAIINVTMKLKDCLNEFKQNKTSDFVIIASDYEQVDLKKNFKIINAELFEQFKKDLP